MKPQSVAAWATVLLVACGGGDAPEAEATANDGGATAAAVDPCELLTAADVEAVFGAPAQAMEELNDEYQCGYWAPETGMVGSTLMLRGDSEFRFSWASDEMRATSEIVDQEGLGDAAVWVADMGMLAVLSGDRTLVLAGGGGLDEKRRVMERVLARK